MKPLTCVLATTLLALQAGCAQNPPYRSHHGQPSIEQMAGELDLTDAQKAQVEQIFASERAQRQQLRESSAQSNACSPGARNGGARTMVAAQIPSRAFFASRMRFLARPSSSLAVCAGGRLLGGGGCLSASFSQHASHPAVRAEYPLDQRRKV